MTRFMLIGVEVDSVGGELVNFRKVRQHFDVEMCKDSNIVVTCHPWYQCGQCTSHLMNR